MRTRIQRKGIYFYCYAESVWRSLEPSVKCGRSGSTPPSQCRFLRPTLLCLGCGPSLYICAFTTVPQVQGLHSQPHIHTQRTLITSLCHHSFKDFPPPSPAIAQLIEHLTVDLCSNQMVPGSIPGGRIFGTLSGIVLQSAEPHQTLSKYLVTFAIPDATATAQRVRGACIVPPPLTLVSRV